MDPKSSTGNNKPAPEDRVTTTCTLLDLSTELLVKIFSCLPAADMITVQCTCRTIRDIFVGTTYLQYILRAQINGVEDFLPPNSLYSERLELLRRHEESWSGLQLNLFTESVIDPSCFPNRFTVQGGYLIYEAIMERVPRYGYTDLCSAARNEELHWVHITFDEERFPHPSNAATFGIDNNLVVMTRFCVPFNTIFTAKPDKSQQRASR